MKITKENLADYLLTSQLVEAGYPYTYDELMEMNEARYFLNPHIKFYLEHTMTVEQNKTWFVKAVIIFKKLYKCNDLMARYNIGWFDGALGLTNKNK